MTLLVHDARISPRQQRILARQRFVRARILEVSFRRQLTGVAKHIGDLVKGFAPEGKVENMPALREALSNYSNILRPWANAVVNRMHAQVGQRDVHAWEELGRTIGRSLRNEVAQAPTGVEMRTLLSEAVELITSLPLEAAKRVHRLTLEGLVNSSRVPEIQSEILRTGHVTASRAKLIARTEIARTASTLTEARATYIGSEGYFWRTSKDSDVRPIHKKLEGKFIRWDNPPIAGERGERAHAGQIYNCRCYPEPVIPDVL